MGAYYSHDPEVILLSSTFDYNFHAGHEVRGKFSEESSATALCTE